MNLTTLATVLTQTSGIMIETIFLYIFFSIDGILSIDPYSCFLSTNKQNYQKNKYNRCFIPAKVCAPAGGQAKSGRGEFSNVYKSYK